MNQRPILHRADIFDLLRASQADPAAQFILTIIAIHADDHGWATLSQQEFTALTNVHRGNIWRSLRRLEANNSLWIPPHDRRASATYVLRFVAEKVNSVAPARRGRIEGQAHPPPSDATQKKPVETRGEIFLPGTGWVDDR